VGFGEKIMQATANAASSVGHATDLVISAPIAIVDPETRDHYGDQIDQFTQSVHQIGPDQKQ
jgi:hypothetical protein